MPSLAAGTAASTMTSTSLGQPAPRSGRAQEEDAAHCQDDPRQEAEHGLGPVPPVGGQLRGRAPRQEHARHRGDACVAPRGRADEGPKGEDEGRGEQRVAGGLGEHRRRGPRRAGRRRPARWPVWSPRRRRPPTGRPARPRSRRRCPGRRGTPPPWRPPGPAGRRDHVQRRGHRRRRWRPVLLGGATTTAWSPALGAAPSSGRGVDPGGVTTPRLRLGLGVGRGPGLGLWFRGRGRRPWRRCAR